MDCTGMEVSDDFSLNMLNMKCPWNIQLELTYKLSDIWIRKEVWTRDLDLPC